MDKETKLKIAARVFFEDGNDYEDYRDAYTEFCANQPTDQFLDFVVSGVLKKEDGHNYFVNDEGHVFSLRSKDGFFKPLTSPTEDEGLKIEEAVLAAMNVVPENISETEAAKIALKQCGFVEL